MILLPLLFLLSPGFGPASAQQTRPNNMVTVSEGEDALLKCDLSSENSVRRSTFDWRKDNGEGEKKEVFMYNKGSYYGKNLTGQNKQFVGRVVFFKDELKSGNASIKIKNTRLEDNGTYSCNVMNPVTSVVHIVLNVVGVLKTRENVTGAAPVPYTYHFHFENGRILLQCKAQGVPKPEVEWRNSSGEALTAENKHVQEYKDASGRFHVEVKVNVTRIDHYTCVVTQRSIYHQINVTLTDIAQDVVIVSEGDDAVLPCSLDSEENMEDLEFSWSTEHEQVFLYDKGRVQEDRHFRGRITHFPHELKSGNTSIKILKTQTSDSGRFTCHYSHNHKSHIVLTVVGRKDNSQSNMGLIIAVAVLVAIVLLLIVGIVLAVLWAKHHLILRPKTGVSSQKEQERLNENL